MISWLKLKFPTSEDAASTDSDCEEKVPAEHELLGATFSLKDVCAKRVQFHWTSQTRGQPGHAPCLGIRSSMSPSMSPPPTALVSTLRSCCRMMQMLPWAPLRFTSTMTTTSSRMSVSMLYSPRSRGVCPAAMASWFSVHMFNDVLAQILKVALDFDNMPLVPRSEVVVKNRGLRVARC